MTEQIKAAENESDLSIGKSDSGNLNFKPRTGYDVKQSADAVKKLGQIKDIRGGTNQWVEVARLLQEVAAADAGKDIKTDVKRLALLELAGISESNGQFDLALQFLAEYVARFETDTIIPEVLLRQAYVLRRMGAYDLAISKLYLVQTAAVKLDPKNLTYLRRVALMAQTEIAETYYVHGRYKEAAEKYELLLRQPDEELNQLVVKAKLVRSLARSTNDVEVVRRAADFLREHSESEHQAEMRYLLATAHKNLGQKQESLRELLLLLEAVEVANAEYAAKWQSWKMLAGNEIGNQLFLEGDYTHAIQVYEGLVALDDSITWKLPILYQIGLSYEKSLAPDKAIKTYNIIVDLTKQETKLESHLQMVVDMARFRSEILSWKEDLERSARPPPVDTKVAGKST